MVDGLSSGNWLSELKVWVAAAEVGDGVTLMRSAQVP